MSLLVAAFGLVALALSTIGVYGVMSHYVQQHLKEISIRVALGGRRRDVLQLVVGQGMTVVAAGVAIGLVVAFWTTRFTQGLLFQVRASDPLVLAAIGGGLLLAALAACLVPAARAAGVEPARLLRQD